MKSWAQLGICPQLVEKLVAGKYKRPLEVQLQTIPMLMNSEDSLIQSETGSGKTLAFALPIMNMLTVHPSQEKYIRALIIVPTRVLAIQIKEVFEEFVFPVGFLIGGQDDGYDPLQHEILIGTPGRLHFTLADGKINLSQLRFLIVDEADKTINMPECREIFKACPRMQRTSGLFSATLNPNAPILQEISKRFSLVRVQAEDYVIPQKLDCWYLQLPIEQKLYWLARYIAQLEPGHKLVVFTLTCNFTRYLQLVLGQLELLKDKTIYCLHGKQTGAQQQFNYTSFAEPNPAKAVVLITTDIAARGLDVDSLGHVLQMDPPKSLDTFLHRAGRTARNNATGSAGVFLTKAETGVVRLLQNKGLPIEEKTVSDIFQPLQVEDPVMSTEPRWDEVEVEQKEKIGALKKQLKKFDRQIQELVSKGLDERDVRKSRQQAIQETQAALEPLLQSERDAFATQQKIYDLPLTVFFRSLQEQDRMVLDACQAAFISYVRAYKEYELKVLLNLGNVHLGPFAMSLGMLLLPKVAELKQYFLNFRKWDGDLDQIAYRDKTKESERLIRVDERQKEAEARGDQPPVEKPKPQGPQPRQLLDKKAKKQAEQDAKQYPQQTKKAFNVDAIDERIFSKEKELMKLLRDGQIDDEEFERRLEEIL